jgi:hypothetical protein
MSVIFASGYTQELEYQTDIKECLKLNLNICAILI